MIEVGDTARYICWIGHNPTSIKKRSRSGFSNVTVLDISPCKKYIKLSGQISWGKIHSFWCEMKYLKEEDFKKGNK